MKVLLIDDHPLILSALRTVIRGLVENVDVIGVATAAEAKRTLSDDSEFDLVLLDLTLTDQPGFELLGELRSTYPSLPIVVVSASDQRTHVMRTIELGAMGYIPKCTTNEALLDALRTVLSGSIYVPPAIMGLHASSSSQGAPAWRGNSAPPTYEGGPVTPERLLSMGFTRRQTEVLELLLQGQPNKLIARKLNLSVETVKDHVAAVLRRLNVGTRTQAVLYFSGAGGNSQANPAWRDQRATPPSRYS